MSSIENSKKKGDTFQNPRYLVTHSWFFAKTKEYLVWIIFEDPKYQYFFYESVLNVYYG